jgi:hypothetical protein
MKFKVGDVIKYIENNYSSHELFIEGEYYTVSDIDDDGDPIIEFDDGELHAEYANYFTLISSNTLEYALSLVGKTVIIRGTKHPFKVDAVGLRNKHTLIYTDTVTIIQDVSNLGYSIILQGEDNKVVSLKEVREITDTVRLNDNYTTRIEGDYITIGGVTIHIDKIQEILDVYNQNKY